MYLLGVLTGLVVAIILVLGSLISHRKGVNLNDKLEKVADVLVPPQRGSVFKPEGLEKQRKDRILQKNNAEGKDTKLSELL